MPEQPQPAGWPRPRAVTELSGGEAAAVRELVDAASGADGAHAVSEDAVLALGAPGSGVRHLLLPGPGPERLAGYAQLPPDDGAAELLVHPAVRRRGAGAVLAGALEALADERPGAPLRVWAHGGSAAAGALARRRGYHRVRELQHRVRTLGPEAPLPPLDLLDDVHVRAFEVGRDEEAWLDLNARAFAHHPEQGRWTAADLAARQGEPWFDPSGLLLALDAQDGRLLASHWTKREAGSAGGEVYVVAVDPASQGRGLGRAVVLAGLHHLQSRGAGSAGLYVEGDNGAALRLYERLGFELDSVDALYERAGTAGAAG